MFSLLLETWLLRQKLQDRQLLSIKEIKPAKEQTPGEMLSVIATSLKVDPIIFTVFCGQKYRCNTEEEVKMVSRVKGIAILLLAKFYPALSLEKIGQLVGKRSFQYINKMWDVNARIVDHSAIPTIDTVDFIGPYEKALRAVRKWIQADIAKKLLVRKKAEIQNGSMSLQVPIAQLKFPEILEQNPVDALPIIAQAIGFTMDDYKNKSTVSGSPYAKLRKIAAVIIYDHFRKVSIVKLSGLLNVTKNRVEEMIRTARTDNTPEFLELYLKAQMAFRLWYQGELTSYNELLQIIMAGIDATPDIFKLGGRLDVVIDAKSIVSMILPVCYPDIENSVIAKYLGYNDSYEVTSAADRGYGLLEKKNVRFITTYNKAVKAVNKWADWATIEDDKIRKQAMNKILTEARERIASLKKEAPVFYDWQAVLQKGEEMARVIAVSLGVQPHMLTGILKGPGKDYRIMVRQISIILLLKYCEGIGNGLLGRIYNTEKNSIKLIRQGAFTMMENGDNLEFIDLLRKAEKYLYEFLESNKDQDDRIVGKNFIVVDNDRTASILSCARVIAKALDVSTEIVLSKPNGTIVDQIRYKAIAAMLIKKYFSSVNTAQLSDLLHVTRSTVNQYCNKGAGMLIENESFQILFHKAEIAVKDWFTANQVRTEYAKAHIINEQPVMLMTQATA